MNVFTLHADGGIICLLCSKHLSATSLGKTADCYINIPARPKCPSRLDNHLNSDQHQLAFSLEKNQRFLTLHTTYQDHTANKINTVAKYVHLVYWIKRGIANRKFASLQTLVSLIRHNDGLCDLRHTSSTTVTEFILVISDYLSDRIVSEINKDHAGQLW